MRNKLVLSFTFKHIDDLGLQSIDQLGRIFLLLQFEQYFLFMPEQNRLLLDELVQILDIGLLWVREFNRGL